MVSSSRISIPSRKELELVSSEDIVYSLLLGGLVFGCCWKKPSRFCSRPKAFSVGELSFLADRTTDVYCIFLWTGLRLVSVSFANFSSHRSGVECHGKGYCAEICFGLCNAAEGPFLPFDKGSQACRQPCLHRFCHGYPHPPQYPCVLLPHPIELPLHPHPHPQPHPLLPSSSSQL